MRLTTGSLELGRGLVFGLLITMTAATGMLIPETAAGTEWATDVAGYAPGMVDDTPTAPYRDPSNALGAPDYDGQGHCTDCTFVSLGRGGSLTVTFSVPFSGGGTTSGDILVYEIGPSVEHTYVQVSVDGISWHSVGTATADSYSSINIDDNGFGPDARLYFVRLIDIADQGQQTGTNLGADIDAVGVVNTHAPTPVEQWTWGGIRALYR